MTDTDKLFLVYSLSEDNWSTLEPPLQYENDLHGRTLGSWRGRTFTVTVEENCQDLGEDEDGFPITAHLIIIWELLDHPKPNCHGDDQSLWEEFDEMPIDMQRWLVPVRLQEYEEVEVSAWFCDEHLLVYSWVPEEGRAFRFVLYNLETKKWEIVEAPNCAVSIRSDDEEDTPEWDREDLFESMGADAFLARSFLDCIVGGGSSDDGDDGFGVPMFEFDDDSSDELWY